MPPRRSHKKSRAGCRRCKNRKIKCDEVHPRCGNCSKHGVPCDFENPEVLDGLTPGETPGGGSSPVKTPTSNSTHASPKLLAALPSFNNPPGSTPEHPWTPADRLMELRLMHQYTNITSTTLFINSPFTADIWQRAVPEMAFSGKTYLVDAMMSVAALHLRSLHPEDRSLARASHAYAASTLQEYLAHLNKGITADNAEALFLTASLIAFQAVASRIFTKDDERADGPSSRYELPLAWFHAFQGVKTVVATSWQWIRGSTVVKAVIDSNPSIQLDSDSLSSSSYFGHLLNGLEDEIANEPPQQASATSQAYYHAVSVLNFAHKSPFSAASLAFPATVSRRFVDLMETKKPRALAILACFFALLKRMDGVWWLKDISRREVMGLMGMFEPGSKWWRYLEWPIRIALWDDGPIPADIWGTELDPEPYRDDGSVEGMMSHIELMAGLMGDMAGQMAPTGAADAVLMAQMLGQMNGNGNGALFAPVAGGLSDPSMSGPQQVETQQPRREARAESPLAAASPD